MVETTSEKLSRLITEERERAARFEREQFFKLSDNPREMIGLEPEPEFTPLVQPTFTPTFQPFEPLQPTVAPPEDISPEVVPRFRPTPTLPPNQKQQLSRNVLPDTIEKPSWYEMPKQWAEDTTEKVGELITQVPILPDALKAIAPVFSWIHENLEKPWASIITSPFSPEIPWKSGESWLAHNKRKFDAWEAPTYVKGLTEFSMPLWWMPWFKWAKSGAKAIAIGEKAVTAISKSGKLQTIAEHGLPKDEVLASLLFTSGRIRAATESIPIVNKIVKAVGGEGAFITKKEAQRVFGLQRDGIPLSAVDSVTFTKMQLVMKGYISDMRNGIKSLLVPRLQVIGKEAEVLGLRKGGIIANIVDKAGGSQYLYDVLEGAMTNPKGYKFLTKEAKKFVDELGDILDDVYKTARGEGVKAPKKRLLHRIVHGKTDPDSLKYEATEYGSLFEKSRVHKLQKFGVEGNPATGSKGGIDYGLDVAESVSSTIDHYVRAIATKRFEKQVGRLGKRPIDKWNALPESTELALLRAAEKEGVLNQPERLAELILMKKDVLVQVTGRQVLGKFESKFSQHPVFKNKIFPKDVVKATERILNDESQKWLAATASASGLSRMLTAAMDLSAPFIQGAASWGLNPVAWSRGVTKMLEFAWEPRRYFGYLVDPSVQAVRLERILAGGSSSTFEFFRALPQIQRVAGRIPVVGGGVKRSIAETWGRAETAFTGFGEVTRNNLWLALKKPGMTDEALMDLSRTIDRMTGVMSTEAIAIGRTQQDFENAFVFFAPRYTRAGLSFVSDALKGGAAGATARESLSKLMASGVAFYYGATKALGQRPNFDPSSGRFMTIKVGDSHVGVGGIMTALMRFAYDIGVTAAEDPSNLLIPIRDGKLNRKDNPFIKFLYSRTAPMTSLFMGTVVEQANYFGEPFESVKDWGEFVANKVTPIASQQIVEYVANAVVGEEQRPFDYPAVAFEFGGLRRFPRATWELMDEERDRISLRDYNKPYDDLNDLNQTRVDKAETVLKLQSEVDQLTVARGDELSVNFINRERERSTARTVYEETSWNLNNAFDAGAIDGIQFREMMADAGYGLGATYGHIDTQPEYAEVLETLQKPKRIKDRHLEDVAWSEYMDGIYRTVDGQSEFEDEFGLFQFDKFNKFIADFREKYGEEIYGYILERKAERDEKLSPLAKELQQAKVILKPYWEVQTLVEERFGKAFAESNTGKTLISKRRRTLRLSNPEMNQAWLQFYSRS